MSTAVENATKKQWRIVDEGEPMEEEEVDQAPSQGPVTNVQQEFSEDLLRMWALPEPLTPATLASTA